VTTTNIDLIIILNVLKMKFKNENIYENDNILGVSEGNNCTITDALMQISGGESLVWPVGQWECYFGIYIYIYMYVYVYRYMNKYIYEYIYICIYIHIYIYIYIYI
jgi:hypothetical protein